MEIIFILVNIILPVFILIGIGCWMHKLFSLDLYSLAKINVYFLIPGFVFISLYKTEFSLDTFLKVLIFFILLSLIQYFIVRLISCLFSYQKGVRVVFTNSVLLFNAGNFGVPVNDLVFKQDPFAMSVQVIIMTFQNVLAYSFGIFTLMAVDKSRKNAVIGMFKMPVLYAMLAGILLNSINVKLPYFMVKSGEMISQAMIAIALFTLGAQVAQLSLKRPLLPVYISMIVRLAIGPFVGFILIYLFKFEGILAQVLFIASGLPSSVNSAIIAQEYQNEPEMAAQIVLTTTVLSVITVTCTIHLSKLLFT
ncbi:AEC family transporter [Peribacillus alkalitolerans]|uniref:AEC family transporter n=1 Tax=Peribacillus alkalitolerans TaxID=1550385 RepID=UPI001F0722BE|nr:AEC family transporter [Peribacillus alkalitolerans]